MFRNRYVSEPIYNENYLLNCIHYIHMNPVKANMVSKCADYKYSSYKQYIKNEGVAKSDILKEIFGIQNWNDIFGLLDSNIMFKDMVNENEQSINDVVKRFEKENNKIIEEILNDKILLKKLIKILKENYKFSYAQIANNFNISRGKLQYILKK